MKNPTTPKKYNFISGLPRSGSTLLSTILNQNPRFTAGISDPLYSFVKGKVRAVNETVGMKELIPDERLYDLIKADFDAFYKNDNEICFNTNRAWTAETPLLKQLYPDFKMILMVRSIPWILDSFERLHRKNPTALKPLYDNVDWASVYDRSHMLMGNISGHSGKVRLPLDCLKQAALSEEYPHLLFIEYEALASQPKEVMEVVYEFLNEPYYEHDFMNTKASFEDYDSAAKIKGLHDVRQVVKLDDKDTILPPDLFHLYKQEDFWEHESSPLKKCRYVYLEK